MKILIISQFYFPETGAASNRIHSMAKTFVGQGHKVTVVAEKPNYPEGVFHKGYEKGLFKSGSHEGVEVKWCWVYTSPKKGVLGSKAFSISFIITAVIAVLRLKDRYDVVIASSPTLFTGLAGFVASRLKKAPFILDIRDLWSDLAARTGEFSGSLGIRAAKTFEEFLYRKADVITTVTRSFMDSIIEKGVDASKVHLVTNGTEPHLFKTEQSKASLRLELGLPDVFIVSYIGDIGVAQGLDHVIQAAATLDKDSKQAILFLFVGDGHRRMELMRMADDSMLRNVQFKGRVSSDMAIKFMSASDALLVSLAKDPIFEKFVPSKLYDGMAASRPILLSAPGESSMILSQANGGVFYPPEDAESLVAAIKVLMADPSQCERLGTEGNRFVRRNYDRRTQALKMLDIIAERINRNLEPIRID
jgi:glycosyltransferase involved in cell wall biosynthesis